MSANSQPRLRDKFSNVCRTRHLSIHTERSYWSWTVQFIKYHAIKSELELRDQAEQKFSDFISSIAPRVSASTQAQAITAIKFFYEHILKRKITKNIRLPSPPPKPNLSDHKEAMSILNSLTGSSKRALEDVYFDGLTVGESARNSGITRETIQCALKKALNKLGITRSITPFHFYAAGQMVAQKKKLDEWYGVS